MARVRKLLVAADGVTAVRVTRTVQELGLGVVNSASREVATLISLARESGADSIHPGCGELAQSVALARACEAAGLTFIGASATALDAIAAKQTAVIPGDAHLLTFQVFADAFGSVVHLNEREGGAAVFEAPSTIITDEQRAEMGALAIQLARDVKLVGAAAVSFFVDTARQFHFAKMTTGLPLEHAVTEWICGVDLVTWQIHVAQGGLLPLTQPLKPRGHSIGVQLTSPSAAEGPFTRLDSSTLSVWAPTRPEAIRKLRRALSENAAVDAKKLDAVIAHETFMRGDADVAYFGAVAK